MGNFLTEVKKIQGSSGTGELKTNCPLIGMSLAKIRELHGSFKSICDNFAINLTEFENIFSHNEATFAIWDADNNGLIDSLELFAGIIMFADSKAEDKIRFLFDLFDFNEIQTLSLMDLEFCVQCVLVSTGKIFNVAEDVSDLDVTNMMRQTFPEGGRINLNQVLRWCSTSDEVMNFFKVFRMEGPEYITHKPLKESEYIIFEKHNYDKNSRFPPRENLKPFVTKSASQLINNKRNINFRSWLNTALQPIISYRLNSKTLHQNYLKEPEDTKTKLEWVYGIRCGDTKRPLQYVVGRATAVSTGQRDKYEKATIVNSEEIVYYTAALVILYNTRLNSQRYYTQHDSEIISLAVSNQTGDLIATGELADYPKIHVWHSRTLDNLAVLKGLHKRGVHLLCFSNNDEYLISCGLTRPSAIIIYDWKNELVLVSISVMNATQDLFMLQDVIVDGRRPMAGDAELDASQENALVPMGGAGMITGLKPPQEEQKQKVVVISLDEIVVFDISKGNFTVHYISFEEAKEHKPGLPICGMSIIADHKNNYYRQQGGDYGEKKHIILTGHKDGSVLIWKLFSYVGVLEKYTDEVTAITKCFDGIAIGTKNGYVYIWDNFLLKCTKTIELSALAFKILSFNIVNIDANQKRILVVTLAGDAIEINLSEYSYNKVKAKKISSITKINGHQKGMCVLNQVEKSVMIGGDMGIVCTYDIETHDLIDVWNVGARVTALACLSLEEGGSFIVAAGTNEGNLIIRQDWEEIVPRHHECGNKTINDVKFSKSGALIAAASVDKHVYILQYQDSDYMPLAVCRLENGFPVALNFSEDSRKIVICTNQRKLLLLDPTTFQLLFKVEEVATCFWSSWVGRYPLITKNPTTPMVPIALGNLSNLVASGDENGNIYVWRSVDAVKDNIGVNLTGHTAHIQRVELTLDDRRLLTVGMTDQTLCQWKISSILEDEATSESSASHVDGVDEHQLKRKIGKFNLEEDSLINELNFCYQDPVQTAMSQQLDQFKDSTVLIRGANHQTVNKILAKMHFNFEPLTWLKQPAMNLVLEHIYGVQTSDRRHSIMYLHFTLNPEQLRGELAKNKSVKGGLGAGEEGLSLNGQMDMVMPQVLGTVAYQQIAGESNSKTIKYEVKHQLCNKALVYFTSRFGVVYSTIKSQQSFYQGHSVKISAIAKHPLHAIVATGEVSNVSPAIHVWDAASLETLVIIKSSHKGGILHLSFSSDGSLLLSLGMDKTFSMQVYQWQQGRTLAYKNLGYFPVFGVRFSPYDKSQIVTCGYEHMAVWKLHGTHITCKTYQRFKSPQEAMAREAQQEQQQKDKPTTIGQAMAAAASTNTSTKSSVLLCLDFMSFKLGNSIQSDVLFGTNLGEITTYCSGKHFILHDNAHEGPINVIRVTDQITPGGVVNIFTGGENGFIKVWDSSCRLIHSVDMRQQQVLADLKNKRAFGVQSLDIYICDKKNSRRVLAGLRCGEIMEAMVLVGKEEKEDDDRMNAAAMSRLPGQRMIQNQGQHMNFDWYPFLSSHASLSVNQNQKKVAIAMHPINSIMASVGDDETLRMWDISKHSIIVSKNLGTQATCLSFSPDGNFLAVGLINGVFLLLESKVEKLNFGTYMEEYHPPSLDVIMSPKESKTAILNIKFSFRGDFIAISYDNEQKSNTDQIIANLSKFNQKDSDKQDTAFVLLYVNRLSARNPGIRQQAKDPYVKMTKILPPTLDASQAHTGSKVSQIAVTQMDFSEDDMFLEMCSQKVQPDQIRDYASKDIDFGYTVWDIVRNQMVTDFEALKKIEWSGWSLSNSINARFQGNSIRPENPEDEKKMRILETCMMSSVSKFGAIDNAVCGSIHGDLYLFRFPAMVIDKSALGGFNLDKIKKSEMALTRGYTAHTSMILHTENFEDKYILTTSLTDQCIVQWRVEFEDQDWELDFNRFAPDRIKQDPFVEVMNQDKFNTYLNEIWNYRNEVAELNQNINQQEFADPACELELDTVIGRRAFDRRNNIKIDCSDRVMYSAGSLIVTLQPNDSQDSDAMYKQTFLRPEEQRFTATSPEVSCFALSEDKRLLFIGTSQSEANIIVWEISTSVQLARFILPNCCSIMYMKIAYDNKHIILVGLTRDFLQVIMICDWTLQEVIIYRQILHSVPFKIKDIAFFPGSTRKFVTCGIQHMCFWTQSGRNLENMTGELTLPRTFTNNGGGVFSHDMQNQGRFGLALVCDEIDPNIGKEVKNDEELENIYVTFLTMGFLKNTLVASGDDGFLYLWENERIIRRLFAHEGSIFTIDTNPKVGLIVSGGMEGNVILWRLLVEQRSNIKSLDKLKTITIAKHMDPQQAVLNPECNIQTVCLGYNRIIIGTRTGTIFETPISDEQKVIKTAQGSQVLAEKVEIKRIIRCIDHENPRSIAIDMRSTRIFILTLKGFFSCWSLQTFDVIYSKNYFKNAKSLIAFKHTNKVMLVFENEIYVVDSNPNYNTFDELPAYTLKLNQISDAKLNFNEKILGVATTSAAAPEVTLYDAENGFTKMKTLYGFKSSIKYIDFSTDNYYLQCEDNLGEVLLFEIETQRIINSDAIDFELEWIGEGLRSYSQLKGVHYWYSQSNKITQITKVHGRPIVAVGDELGTIRLYNYPNTVGEGYYQCYSDHLFTITSCSFSPDRMYFLSTSEVDRCIFKWKVVYNAEKIKKLIAEHQGFGTV